jgi:hypothetical protein
MASVTIDGLDELIAQLRDLPADLTAEASNIVVGAANGAEADIRAEYPPGTLRESLSIVKRDTGGPFAAGVTLKNTSKVAFWWDNGTEARHYFTASGARHDTGAMWGRKPAPHTFVRNSIKARRLMYGQLATMLVRNGLVVSGSIDE